MKKFLTAVIAVILTIQIGVSPALAQNMNYSDMEPGNDISDLQEENLADAEPDSSLELLEYDVTETAEDASDDQNEKGTVVGNPNSEKYESETEKPDDNDAEEDGEPGKETEVISLAYDDRYSFADDYEGYVIHSIENVEIMSKKVECGNVTSVYDDAVLTVDDESNTDVIAAGVGTAEVTLIKESEYREEEADTMDVSEIYSDSAEQRDTIIVEVTVCPAPLTLMFISGQSNAEGWCSSNTGYRRDHSVICEPGEVYSTYAPTMASMATCITGIGFSMLCNQSNAADFVAEALTKNVSLTGKELEYPLNTLTEEGEGKTGIDSGLAYEWNQLTGDKVWVVNAAWGGSSITSWIPDAALYERAEAVYDQVYRTYSAEIEAGHYAEGDQLLFWLQGEKDKYMSTSEYGGYFQDMYDGLMADFSYLDGIGVISVRSSLGSYINEDELQMTAPRIVQYLTGASEDYEKLYVVSNVNEQWVSNAGVAAYFSQKYGRSLSYPMRTATSVPRTMALVHSDIHYSQIGHNENGITAAEGLYHALQNDEYAQPRSVSWRCSTGEQISKLYVLSGQAETVVPVVEPVYSAKKLTIGSYKVNYNAVLGQVLGKPSGNGSLLARKGSLRFSELPVSVSVSDELDFTDIVGEDYTDFYYCQGKWYYLENGKTSMNTTTIAEGTVNGTSGWWYVQDGVVSFSDTVAEGTVKGVSGWWYVKDGQVDFSYSGVAKNENGWWRIEDGKVNLNFNGFAENSNGWWYLTGGKVQFGTNDVIKGTVNGTDGWWYVVGGKVTFTDTVAKNSNGWWRIEEGKVNFNFDGFAENSNGWWYLTGGKVQFGTNDVIKGNVNDTSGWWYVAGGKVTFTNTVAKNSNGWWYIKNGMVDFSHYGVEKNSNGWWRIEGGKVNFNFNGFAENSNGWWYLKGGKVQFGTNDVIKGTVNGITGWWYVAGGKVTFTDTVAKNSNGWWYIKDGMVDFSHYGVEKNSNGWWRIEGGMVNFNYNGVAQNSNGWWYIRGGKVDFSYNGYVNEGGSIYRVVQGKVYR